MLFEFWDDRDLQQWRAFDDSIHGGLSKAKIGLTREGAWATEAALATRSDMGIAALATCSKRNHCQYAYYCRQRQAAVAAHSRWTKHVASTLSSQGKRRFCVSRETSVMR